MVARHPIGWLPPRVIARFSGLDLRPGQFGEDTPSLLVGNNLSVIPGGALKTRPAMRVFATVSAQSVGLYARGGVLRCIVPAGQSLQDTQPPGIQYDAIGGPIGSAPAAYPLSTIARLVFADTYGAIVTYGPNAYVVIKRVDGKVEHHWIKDPPISSATGAATKVILPFTPGEALTKLAEHMWATAPQAGTVPFSSVQFGPSDWQNLSDAGFLPVLNHISGNRFAVALNQYRGMLAVFFTDAVQLWSVATDPAGNILKQVLNGPGAILPGAVANVLGDVVYLSQGGFRSLNTATVTGEAHEDDIGTRIQALTDLIDPALNAVTIWSQSRQQFLCAIGTNLYALTNAPAEKMQEWSYWTLPTAIESMVELNGVLYARSGTTVYVFDDTQDADYNGVRIAWTMQTRPMSLRWPGRKKSLHYLTVRQTAPAAWCQVVDGSAFTPKYLPACSPKSLRIPISGEGVEISLQATGTGQWRLEGVSIEAQGQVQ